MKKNTEKFNILFLVFLLSVAGIFCTKEKDEAGPHGTDFLSGKEPKRSSETLTLVTLSYPPYEYEENGEMKGVVVEIVNEAFRRMGKPIEIKLYPWERSLMMMETGTADVIFTIFRTPERERFLYFSKEVLMPQVISLFVPAESEITFDGNLAKLAKYRFGVVHKVNYGIKFNAAVKAGIIQKVEAVTDAEQNVNKLLAGRIDIMLNNKLGGIEIISKMKKQNAVRELVPEVESVLSYIAFSKKKNLSNVRDQFDMVLSDMKQDGTYHGIIKRYFGR